MSKPQQAKGRGWRGPRVVLQKVSFYWALLVGLLSPAAQALEYYICFDRWNTEATITEYFLFFLAGTLGGVILIFFHEPPGVNEAALGGADHLPAGFLDCTDHDDRRWAARSDWRFALSPDSMGTLNMDRFLAGEVHCA